MNWSHCHHRLIEIDRYGERLIGCVECNRWRWRDSERVAIELLPEDIEALRGLVVNGTHGEEQ